LISSVKGQVGKPNLSRRTTVAAKRPARASLRYAKAPLSPRYRRKLHQLSGHCCSLRDELLNEEIFDTLDDARRKLALWRYDYNAVRPHSSLGNQTPLQARQALEQFEGSAPGALAQGDEPRYQNPNCSLSL